MCFRTYRKSEILVVVEACCELPDDLPIVLKKHLCGPLLVACMGGGAMLSRKQKQAEEDKSISSNTIQNRLPTCLFG